MEFTGKNLVAKWIYSGGTIDLSADTRTCNIDPSIGYSDSTAGSDNSKGRLATVKEFKASLAGVLQTGGTATEDALVEGTGGTLMVYPEGTASGKRKYTCPSFSDGMAVQSKYDDTVTWTCTFTSNGDLVRGTN